MRQKALLTLLLALAWTMPALAQTVALRWSAKDGHSLAERTLDLAALDALPQMEIVTSTPWTEGIKRFTGPTLLDLARLTGFDPATVRVAALNDFVSSIPATDWKENSIVFSTRLDGKSIRVRENGPFWIMYPINKRGEFAQLNYRSRMVWQVKSLDFVVE
ncbi:hypothetical protein ABLE91_01690 [Aquabacter sp. CN5-332]